MTIQMIDGRPVSLSAEALAALFPDDNLPTVWDGTKQRPMTPSDFVNAIESSHPAQATNISADFVRNIIAAGLVGGER